MDFFVPICHLCHCEERSDVAISKKALDQEIPTGLTALGMTMGVVRIEVNKVNSNLYLHFSQFVLSY